MEIQYVYTESPEEEQWRMLLQYSYPQNIKKFLKEKSYATVTDDLIESISGSILQAKEYFEASNTVSLLISPLLLYYGTTNLLYGIGNLINGRINKIHDHGMRVTIPEQKGMIGDIEIIPNNPDTGALSVFTNILSQNNHPPIANTGTWNVSEILGSIPDLLDDFLSCYSEKVPYVIPLDVVKEKNSSYEKVDLNYTERFASLELLFEKILDFKKNYLKPQITSHSKKLILRPKMFHNDIGIYSLSGRKFLSLSHEKQGQAVSYPLETLCFMALFSLGYISRYRPEIWNPFVRNDTSGEKMIIEKFLDYIKRSLPNLILNFIYKKRIRFINSSQGFQDLSSLLTTEQVEQIARDEIKKYVDRERGRL